MGVLEIFSLLVAFIILLIGIFVEGGNTQEDEQNNKNNEVVGGANKSTSTNLMIFHRDLRAIDNTALNMAAKDADAVMCVFIFDDAQVGPINSFRSVASIQFMIESIEELNKSLDNKLVICRGNTANVVEGLIKDNNIKGVYFNADYTPFAVTRDKKIQEICEKASIPCYNPHDVLILDGKVTFYKKFTPFHNMYAHAKIRDPNMIAPTNIANQVINRFPTTLDTIRKLIGVEETKEENKLDIPPDVEGLQQPTTGGATSIKGGRNNGLAILNSLVANQPKYNVDRDMLAKNTTRLSAHNKFGTLSCREVYYAFARLPASSKDLTKQMFWRDFYYTLMINDPNALKGSFNSKYDTDAIWLPKQVQDKHFLVWTQAATGFPVVDACMRELNTNNYMHNRGRMIVADFLIKLLGVEWRRGEKYFAQQLFDYDPAQNNYNWQWVAGTGPFSQPDFRVFNPRLQSEKFDPKCEYIYKWLPELKDVPAKDIHNWDLVWAKYPNVKYAKPIISYETSRDEYMQRIKLK